MKKDEEYWRRLNHFKGVVQSSFKRRKLPLNKFQLTGIVGIMMDNSYRPKKT